MAGHNFDSREGQAVQGGQEGRNSRNDCRDIFRRPQGGQEAKGEKATRPQKATGARTACSTISEAVFSKESEFHIIITFR